MRKCFPRSYIKLSSSDELNGSCEHQLKDQLNADGVKSALIDGRQNCRRKRQLIKFTMQALYDGTFKIVADLGQKEYGNRKERAR